MEADGQRDFDVTSWLEGFRGDDAIRISAREEGEFVEREVKRRLATNPEK